jgi:hypothetical protein
MSTNTTPEREIVILPGRPSAFMTFEEIGRRMLAEAGEEACRKGYGTTDPEWVGRYALMYGDANADGTLN